MELLGTFKGGVSGLHQAGSFYVKKNEENIVYVIYVVQVVFPDSFVVRLA